MSQEQRTSPRKTLHALLRLGSEEAHGEMHLDARNLSAGGAFLESELLFEPGESLELALDLPDGGRTIRGRATVAWVSRGTDHPPGMGLTFEGLSPEDQDALAGFVSGAA